MRPVPGVAMEPPGQRGVSLLCVLECGGVGPFSECGLNEALGLAVRWRGVGPDPDVLDSELLAGAGEGFGEIAAAIVSHDAFDGNAKALEVGNGGDQECNSAFLLLVGEDVGTRYPGMVIDGDVDEFPACALTAAIACAASIDAMANTVEAAEFCDGETHYFCGPLALVSRVSV